MIIPLKHRYLFWHDTSDAYLPIHLAPSELGAWHSKHNDGNFDDVTGVEHHEKRYFSEKLCKTGKLLPGKLIPLRCRYLAWFDHNDDQYYQEMFLTYEQQFSLFGAFDDLHCPDNVTGDPEHEEKFKRIKMAIKEKMK